MAFNFNLTNTKGESSNKRLKPYEIHDVKLESAKIEDVEIKNGERAGETVRTIKVRFSNDNGYYEETVFYNTPTTDKDVERKEGPYGPQPSNLDRAMMFVAHVTKVINEEHFKKMQEASVKFQDFDDVAKFFVAVMEKNIGKETKLKLVGYRDKNGYVQSSLPFFTGVSKDGDAYIKDNFLGDKVAFSNKELTAAKSFNNAAPTEMKSDPELDAITAVPESNNITSDDMTDLLAGL